MSATAPLVSANALTWIHTVMAIVLVAGLLVLWIGRSRRDDHVWFDCRAIAESVKTATWRFMMGAPPFNGSDNVEQRFISELQEIRKARPDCGSALAGMAAATASPPISDAMRRIRSGDYATRKAFYLAQRVQEQKAWYSQKAETHAKSGDRWFWTTVVFQIAAVSAAIIQAVVGNLGVNLLPVITTCTAAVVAWNQIKRHDELKKTYALAAQELGDLETIANSMSDDSNFPQLVEQVEDAISREHTMWCARRDVPLRQFSSFYGEGSPR